MSRQICQSFLLPKFCAIRYTYIHTYINTYRIVDFYHEDFNIAFGSIRNIKIRIIFVKRNILWQVSHSNTSIILQSIVYRSTIDLLYRVYKSMDLLPTSRSQSNCSPKRCSYLSIHMVAMNAGRDNQLHPTLTE